MPPREQILDATEVLMATRGASSIYCPTPRLERSDDPAITEVVGRVQRVLDELTSFAVAQSGGIFFATQLEPGATDVDLIYRRLLQALTDLLPILLEEND